MAWARAQTAKVATFASGSANLSLSFTSNTTVGNRAVLILKWWKSGGVTLPGTSAVSDPKNGTWTRDFSNADSGSDTGIAVYSVQIATQILSTDTITVTVPSGGWSGSASNCRYSLLEYSSLATSSAFDTSALSNGSSTGPSSGNTGTPATSGELAITVFVDNSGLRTWSAAPSGTAIDNGYMNSGAVDIWDADASTTGSVYSNSGTLSGTAAWQMAVVVYKLNITVPGAPTIGTATAGNLEAFVPYTAPGSNGGSAITSYTATSTPDSHTGTLSTAGSGTITVTGLTNGTAYTFTVHATNVIGNSLESSSSNSVTPDPTVPGAPTIGTARVSGVSGTASVSFTPPGSNGGATITGYTATSTPSSITGSGSGSPVAVSGLANGTSYTFTVHATNSVGNSSESSASNSVTPYMAPIYRTIQPS